MRVFSFNSAAPMSNPNSSLLLFIICLMIISSQSFDLICKADDHVSNEIGAYDPSICFRRLLGTTKSDMPHTTFGSDDSKAMPPVTNGEEFNYVEGDPLGPKNWGTLSPNWITCVDGKSQSPINIDVKLAQVAPADLKKAYLDSSAKLVNGYNNIGVKWLGDAGGIVVNGSTYKLLQCHWHTPSEHTLDGKKFDAELHLVHGNDKGQKAVIGIFQTIGQPDPFIESLTEKMELLGTNEEIDLGNLSASNIRYGSKRYYRYSGSFTTPPCTEGVIWTLAEKVRSISRDQIKLLKGTHERDFLENARPIQPLGERPIWKFDSPKEIE